MPARFLLISAAATLPLFLRNLKSLSEIVHDRYPIPHQTPNHHLSFKRCSHFPNFAKMNAQHNGWMLPLLPFVISSYARFTVNPFPSDPLQTHRSILSLVGVTFCSSSSISPAAVSSHWQNCNDQNNKEILYYCYHYILINFNLTFLIVLLAHSIDRSHCFAI